MLQYNLILAPMKNRNKHRTMSPRPLSAILLFACLTLPQPVYPTPRVVVSIAPLHSLLAAVMQGMARPELLVPAGASHHAYSLRPSDVRNLHGADLVVWIGKPLERFLANALTTLDPSTQKIAVAKLPEIALVPARQGGVWGEGQLRPTRGRPVDPHLWLNPANARVIVEVFADHLAKLDPANAGNYVANAQQTLARLANLEADLTRRLEPIVETPYVVYHDAYHYFETRYSLAAVGSITSDPDSSPGARRILEIRDLLSTTGVRCVFSEPQFQPALVRTVIEDTRARRGMLDPTGAGIEPGPNLYFDLMNRLADSLVECLQ
jgi:zinc transport system substrate-binding protein